MRRLYVVLPDHESCKRVVDTLEEAGVAEHHLHVVASLTQDLQGLPEASAWQKTELAHGIEWGIGLGGAAGLLGGQLAILYPPGGLTLGWEALLAGGLGGALVGALIIAILGSHAQGHWLEEFQREISAGRLLLMADVPKTRVPFFQALIVKQHPGARVGILKRR